MRNSIKITFASNKSPNEFHISKRRQPNGGFTYRFTAELDAMRHGKNRFLHGIAAMGLLDPHPQPRGKAKQYWVMRLRRLPGRNRLPRGFSKKPLFV